MQDNQTSVVELDILSPFELAQLGDGEVAYVKELTSNEAQELFPAVDGIPAGIALFALHSADGTPLALTDSLSAALAHAMEDDLEVASVH
ncbi:MAG: DUF1150 domain-containing protein [Pseudomonadota bacterium]